MRGKRFDGDLETGGANVEPGQPKRDGDAEGASTNPKEHLTRDLARVRAKFGVDPALAGRSLAAAWQSDSAVEEDEAEFVDTLADCLGAGLSLDDALNCWDTGDLVYQAAEDGNTPDGEPDEPAPIALPSPRRPTGAHRVLVR